MPDLPDGDPCRELEPAYVPASVVRQQDLPPIDYNLIALVPWYNATCTKSYLESVMSDPLRGFITYVPGSNSTEKPPGVDDPMWDLRDHGAWKDAIKFPVYAISSSRGLSMMTQLSLYSGNVSSVPFGANISELYSPNDDDYIRIWTAIHVHTPSSMPTIWVFILACVGVLIAFVLLVSCLLHLFQRRRRRSLQRRVATGEVNLEAMNIKRVLVPIQHVEKFPLFTYNYEPKLASPPSTPMSPRSPAQAHLRQDSIEHKSRASAPSETAADEKILTSPRSTVTGVSNASSATDYQPQCTICLENYENRSSIIRELPCGHIYHPDCIDEYLSENSSLCPQCKASMLPLGFCPPITNAMVRRERALRRLRGHITVDDGELAESPRIWRSNMTKKLFRPSNHAAASAVHQVPDRHSPTAEARVRMRDLAGSVPDDGEDSEGQPTWKKIRRAVFPGLR